MKRLMVASMLALLCGYSVVAKDVVGIVTAKDDGKPVVGAMVYVKKANGGILKYMSTDEFGKFCIGVGHEVEENCFMEVRMMGFKAVKIERPFPDSLSVVLETELFALEEVIVKAKKVEVRGDTVSYSVPTILTNDDRVLGDVLSKIPGVTVDAKGYVNVQGKPINRLYIDGNDLLESKYNVATQNIDPNDVSTIQVLEKHQPIRALEGLADSDKAALNIILKPNARGKWIATLQAEAGVATEKPAVPYSAGAFVMNVGRKFQTVNTVKTDAAGNDIIRSNEVSSPGVTAVNLNNMDFIGRYRQKDYLWLSMSMPPINTKRTRFNTSYSVSTDNKFVLKSGSSLGVSGEYENNSLSGQDYSSQIYYDEHGKPLKKYVEENVNRTNAWYGAAEAKLDINTPKLYLKDNLRFSMSGNSSSNALKGTALRNEYSDGRNMELINKINFVVRSSDKSAFSISMLSQYAEKTESLKVMSPDDNDTVSQGIGTKFFYNDVYFSNRFAFGKYLTLSSFTNLELLWRDFRTDLYGIRADSLQIPTFNDMEMFYIKPHESLYLKLALRKFEASLSVDAWYQYIGKEHHFAINPGLYLKYKFGARFNISANVSYGFAPIDEQETFSGVIMQNYKYLTLGRKNLKMVPSFITGGEVSFHEPLTGWSVVGNVTYRKSESFESARYFIGDYIVQQESDSKVPYEYVFTTAIVEKAFLDISGKLSFGGSFGKINTSIRQNDMYVDYSGYNAEARLKFEGTVAKWMKIKYAGEYRYNRYNVENGWNSEAMHSLNHGVTMTFFPSDKFEIDVICEHHMDNVQSGKFKHTVFADASVWYFINDRIQLFLHAKNLLNQKQYSYTALSPLFMSVYSYRIRPLNVLFGIQVKF